MTDSPKQRTMTDDVSERRVKEACVAQRSRSVRAESIMDTAHGRSACSELQSRLGMAVVVFLTIDNQGG